MLRFAVCDDNEKELKQALALLEDYLLSRPGLAGRAEAFSSCAALLEKVHAAGGFDLYLLDILMPGQNGIETGRRLRALGDGGEIVYLTNSNDFAADSYEVGAFFYLLKPVSRERLFEVLDRAVQRQRERQGSAVVVSTAQGPRRILLEHIRYAERVGRRVRYYCTDGTVDSQSIRLPFREAAAPLLADRRFYLCGASFVLNFQHVTGVQGQSALFDNGQALTLPRSAAANFKMAWGSWWLGEGAAWQTS